MLWVVLEGYELSWFSQNEEAPRCPHRNYFEKLMQTFERKEGRKKKKRKYIYMPIYDYMEPCR